MMGSMDTVRSMNVNLTPGLERLIQEKVASGLYNNQSEVVREALRLLADHDQVRVAQVARLRAALDEGLAQAERGELRDGAEVIQKARARLSSRRASRKKG